MSGLKRKRGRPRRDEAREINNFDLSLIEEYRKRPAFYDREHPHYRNRELMEPEWHVIARTMNCSVAFVKDRLTILRNRFSLEKRRLDSLQAQFKDSKIASQWPLYENLNFLNDFIKTRRSFNSFAAPKAPSSNSSNDNHANGDAGDDDDDDDEEDNESKDFKNTPNAPSPYMPPQLDASTIGQSEFNSLMTGSLNRPRSNLNDVDVHGHHVRVRNVQDLQNLQGAEKFNAFGHFLASSLIEMHEKDALRLVEKFTTELVNCMLTGQ